MENLSCCYPNGGEHDVCALHVHCSYITDRNTSAAPLLDAPDVKVVDKPMSEVLLLIGSTGASSKSLKLKKMHTLLPLARFTNNDECESMQ